MPDGVYCTSENGKNETARSCFYGGKCDGRDCCEYIILTGHSRPKAIGDKYPYNYCTAYKPVTPEEKRQRLAILNQKLGEYSKMHNKECEGKVFDVLVDGISKTDARRNLYGSCDDMHLGVNVLII